VEEAVKELVVLMLPVAMEEKEPLGV